MDEVKSFKVGDLTVTIYYDEDPINPREEYDNFGTMVAFHKRYNLGDKTDFKSSNYGSWRELEKDLIENHDAAVILPLWLYDHSGLRISTGSFMGRAQHAEWDSGRVGFTYATRADVEKEFGVVLPEKLHGKYAGKRWFGPEVKKALEDAERTLVSDVETYDLYLSGQVYGYEVREGDKEDPETGEVTEGEVIDSCWGFIGDLSYVEGEARKAAEGELKRIKKGKPNPRT